jgi:hypothetical protein
MCFLSIQLSFIAEIKSRQAAEFTLMPQRRSPVALENSECWAVALGVETAVLPTIESEREC